MSITPHADANDEFHRYGKHARHNAEMFLLDTEFIETEAGLFYHGSRLPNTASLMLSGVSDSRVNSVVIEGAPGQGKSTITQYVCQVNRLKLLGKSSELQKLPKSHADAPVRLPFRIDLRDYASWVSGRSVFATEGQPPPKSLSLESFLAAQVSSLSGGHDFTPADLISVIRHGHAIIVLDGFDEVADIPTRLKVVEEITRAAARMQAQQRQTQIVVTSRPAAFANSPGFPRTDWIHLELQSMTPAQIDEYSKKWMSARSLPQRERLEFTSLLKEKLDQPHMRELSRNPMQLTILLALIHTRGLSLPDKRTSLYDNYMELFFSRESEKSRIVREHRDLLVDIHRYLAWILHTSSEDGRSSGSIAEPDLRILLREYLKAEGHEGSLVDELFTGMVERVVALVSRVQGTYEFEVQPLREYFAARHLYDTAPYSPPGDEKSGTKPDRFDALSRNFYWLNVSRFFCGCFSRGELSSLVDSIHLLVEDEDYGIIAHPYQLCVMLLGDWVFSQQPLLVARVIEILTRRPGFKILLSSLSDGRSDVALPDRCGRLELAEKAYAMLDDASARDYRGGLLDAIRANTDLKSRSDRWLNEETTAPDIGRWLADGLRLGLLVNFSVSELLEIARRHDKMAARILVQAQRFDVVYADPVMLDEVSQQILDGSIAIFPPSHQRMPSSLEVVGEFLSPAFLNALVSSGSGISARHSLMRHGFALGNVKDPTTLDTEMSVKLTSACRQVIELLETEGSTWSNSYGAWRKLYDLFHSTFGATWATARIAAFSANIQSPVEQGQWSARGWRDADNFVDSMRFARLRSGSASWWRHQLLEAHDAEDVRPIVLLAYASWATPRTIVATYEVASAALDLLTDEEWRRLYRAVIDIRVSNTSRSTGNMGDLNSIKSYRFKTILADRLNDKDRDGFICGNMIEYSGDDIDIKSFIGRNLLFAMARNYLSWDEYVDYFRIERFGLNLFDFGVDLAGISEKVARRICHEAESFPAVLVKAAQRIIALGIGSSAEKLGEIAERDNWFQATPTKT